MKPLQYVRRLTEAIEDTRRAVVFSSPRKLAAPDERGVFKWNGWRGVERAGVGYWQTEECWNQEIAEFPGDYGVHYHYTRRDYAIDVETTAMPEQWWRGWFAGVRARNLRMAMPDGGEDKMFHGDGTGRDQSSKKGNSVYIGSDRAPVKLRMYTKYLRDGVDVNVRQAHRDVWARAGWTGGLVVRCEFQTMAPAEMRGTPAERWSDCAARIRLLDAPADGRRGTQCKTAERWSELGGEVKQFRERKASCDKTLKLARSIKRLLDAHTYSEISLALLASKPVKQNC